jgi:hypothetical protein
MEEWPPIWRVAVSISNKQAWTGDKCWYSSLGVGLGANNSLTIETYHVMNHKLVLQTWTDPLVWTQDRDRWQALVNAAP